MNYITRLFSFFIILSVYNSVLARGLDQSSVGLSYGDTYVKQNIKTLNYSELFFRKQFPYLTNYLPDFVRPMYELNAGLLSTKAGQGSLVGVGPRLELGLSKHLSIGGAFRFVYLDKYVYQAPESNNTRHYGGHRQFQYYLELDYNLNNHVIIGYRWLHMSNGKQVIPEPLKYDHNPVIETRNLVVRFPF